LTLRQGFFYYNEKNFSDNKKLSPAVSLFVDWLKIVVRWRTRRLRIAIETFDAKKASGRQKKHFFFGTFFFCFGKKKVHLLIKKIKF